MIEQQQRKFEYPGWIMAWKCIQCGELAGGGIKSQKGRNGIAGRCRFCGVDVAVRLCKWNSIKGFIE